MAVFKVSPKTYYEMDIFTVPSLAFDSGMCGAQAVKLKTNVIINYGSAHVAGYYVEIRRSIWLGHKVSCPQGWRSE